MPAIDGRRWRQTGRDPQPGRTNCKSSTAPRSPPHILRKSYCPPVRREGAPPFPVVPFIAEARQFHAFAGEPFSGFSPCAGFMRAPALGRGKETENPAMRGFPFLAVNDQTVTDEARLASARVESGYCASRH
jgi:hypothetical protein